VRKLVWRRRLAISIVTLTGLGWSMSPSSADLALPPDLGMARVSTVRVDTNTIPGRRLLRYEAIIVNVGGGPFVLKGHRADTTIPELTISQRVFNDSGGYVDVPISGTTMYWSGDGHNHWHTRDLESGVLTRMDNGRVVGTSAKHGFHFADNYAYRLTLPGAPQTAVYTGAAYQYGPGATDVTMGLSVGWGDRYAVSVVDQWIDITGLPNGKYRLELGADTSHWFQESDITNNTAWATLRIRRNRVNIVATGAGA
jgi:Lysyl oxidase